MSFDVPEKPQWCPGCGNYPILTALKQALTELDKKTSETVICSGVGCGSKIPHYLRCYGYEGLHGRPLPLAEGIKLANPNLLVITIAGDGDGLSEGTQHFVHSARRNHDVNYFIQDNQLYALTTGQVSPTSLKGLKTKTTPAGNTVEPIKTIPLMLLVGASFVATAFAGDIHHMKEVFKKAIQHKGFSFVNIYQPCVTWNSMNTYDWWRERVYKLEDAHHDVSDWDAAFKKAMEPYESNFTKFPIGVFYQVEKPPLYDREKWARENPPVQVEKRDVSHLIKEFM
ncbi:MAG: thiamine pyrophosphate-dependent enzyme [Candidatus Anstonellales archaeon]